MASKFKAIFNQEFSLFLSEVASGAEKQILSNFDKEKDVDGNDFEPLKDSTRKERRSKGYRGANPILKRTKNLRNSIKVIADLGTKNVAIDYPFYAEYLNDGRSDMKSRRIIDMPDDWKVGGSKRDSSYNAMLDRWDDRMKDFINIFKEK